MPIEELASSLADAAVALWQEAGLTRAWNDPHADLRRALDHPTSTVLAVVEGDVLLGTVMVGYDGHRGNVYYLAVREDRRGSGLGRALMDAAEEWLRARGVPKLNLMVRRTNLGVVAFYAGQGYQDGDVVVMGKFLL